jgi:putative inorganic carbon (hco3(-)) transporter
MITLIIARLITVVLSIFMLLFFFSPAAISMCYLIIRPVLQPFAYHEYTIFGDIPLTSIFSLIIIASAYFNGFFQRTQTIKHVKLVPLYLMLYFSIMSFFFTPSFSLSIGHLLKILTALAFYALIFNAIRDIHDRDRILWAYLLCAIVPMIFGFYQYITGTGHAWAGQFYSGKRIDSFLGEWNAYGEFLCICICATLMLLIGQQSRNIRILILTVLSFLVLSLILSLNRGSWISLLIGFVVASAVYHSRIKTGLVIAGIIVVFALFGGVIYERFAELHQLSQYGNPQDTLQGRMKGWGILIPFALERPFFGHGLGTSIITIKQRMNIAFAPHNDYLRLSVEIGIIGMLFYVFFLGAELWRGLKSSWDEYNWNLTYPLLIAVIYFIIISFFQNIIYNVTVFPMFLGLVALVHKSQIIAASRNTGVDSSNARH